MDSKLKKRLFWFAGVVVLVVTAYLLLNYTIKSKLEDGLKKIPETVKIEYKTLQLSVLTGGFKLVEPTFSVYGKTTNALNLQVSMQDLSIKDFSYWQYFVNDKIAVNHVVFNAPKVIYYHNNLVKSKSYKSTFSKGLRQVLAVESLEVVDGNVLVFQASNDSLLLKSDAVNFKIEHVEFNQNISSSPLSYDAFALTSTDLFYRLNTYENLILGAVEVNSKSSKIKGLALKTKYSKTELSKHLKKERDHFNLTIDSLVLNNQDFGFSQDASFHFKAPEVMLYNPDIQIYRDKLLPDDQTYKPLYSKMLRQLNFDLALDKLLIDQAKISYTEKVEPNTKGGKLVFTNLDAEIKNLGNVYSRKTSAHVDALFMDNTPINVQWKFDVNDPSDTFLFKSEIETLRAEKLNQFTKPNLNVKLEGELTKLYFTVGGNDSISRIDTKLKYDNFDVVILKKNGKEKNKLLSAVLNIFISKDSRDDADKFSYGSKTGIDRDTTKSVFNYVWINLKASLTEAITGSGKKSD